MHDGVATGLGSFCLYCGRQHGCKDHTIDLQGLAAVVAAVDVSEALTAKLIPVATGLGDLLQGLEPCYRAHTHRCKA